MPDAIRITTIDHIGIPIWDRRVSLPFYRDILGLKVIPSMVDSPNIVWTRTLDGTMVHLVEPLDGENLAGHHTAFQVEDFDSVVTGIRDSGFPNIGEPGERYDGQRYIFIFDNDGNRTEFTTAGGLRPSTRVVDANGYTSDSDTRATVRFPEGSPTAIKVITIDHVGLPISNRTEGMKFYRVLLNFRIIPHQADGNSLAWMEMGDSTMVHLIDPPESLGPLGDTRQHVAFEVVDIEATADALEDAEIEIVGALGIRSDGQQYLFIYDPDGNRIEFVTRGDHTNMKRTADENGYTSEDGELL